jgi:hypothetical protein
MDTEATLEEIQDAGAIIGLPANESCGAEN